MFKSRLAKILWLILILMFSLTLPVIYFSYQIIIPKGKGEACNFEIKQGESLSKIAYNLRKENLIRSSFCFKLLAYFSKNTDNLKFGEYKLNPEMNSAEILKKIVKGEVVTHFVTIPEGFTTNQIAELLDKFDILNKKDFLNLVLNNKLPVYDNFIPKNLEGYFFPDSYSFAKGTPPERVIDKVLSRFQEKVLSLFKEKSDFSMNGLSFEQLIILASIIEREVRIDSERPQVASVYYNRLRENWPLECDATIQYILEKRKNNLNYLDLKITSPYNTYLNKGLPPTPICNPGLESIKAVINPAKTNYFFYVRNDKKGDGSHVFSKSYRQHIEAINKYQKY